MIYLSHFEFLHIEQEYSFIMGLKRTCYDTVYPFQILFKHHLKMLDFDSVTILYGGNGSGKSTALNVIAEKLNLQRDTLYNRSNFSKIIRICAVMRQNVRFPDTVVSLPAMMCLILC